MGVNYSYAYDENGLRTQKTVNGVTTNYYYNGSVLIGMVTGSGTSAKHQLFSYDSSGNVVSVDYSSNGGSTFTTYYYLRNAQNDVVKLIDGTGATVVSYTYDSWGKLIATTGALASTLGQNQPFRYRGYVCDAETGWYYLQSRYYNPTICRFISSDVLLSTGQGVLGHNAYAYCLNNPVNMADPSGRIPWWIILLLVATAGMTGCASNGSTTPTPTPAPAPPATTVYDVAPKPTATPTSATPPPSKTILACLERAKSIIGSVTYKQMPCSNLVDECYGEILKPKRILAASQYDYVKSDAGWETYYDSTLLRAGDLIFYTDPSCTCGKRTEEIHHVAIYSGGGMMIDSTKSSFYGIDGVSERSIMSVIVNDATGVEFQIFCFARYIGD